MMSTEIESISLIVLIAGVIQKQVYRALQERRSIHIEIERTMKNISSKTNIGVQEEGMIKATKTFTSSITNRSLAM